MTHTQRRAALAAATERQLLRAAADDDDREAFDELMLRFRPRLFRMALNMVQPTYGEDLLQECLCRAWRSRKTYRGEAEPFTWLVQIMRRAATSPTLRPIDSSGLAKDLECIRTTEDFDAFCVKETFDACLAKLGPREKSIILRRHREGQKWHIIVREMGFRNVYFARKAYTHAITKLHRLLG